VNDTGTTGSTITLVNKEGANNVTKHASIGFVNTDTTANGKFGGQIGFWPEDSNASKQQFRIYTSGTQAGYNLPVQRMVVTGDGDVGIGTNNPRYPLSFERAGFGIKTAVVNPMSTAGHGDFNLGELYVGDNVVSECIAIYNPTSEGSYTFKCGYVQWIQMKVRGQGVQNTIQVIKSNTADNSTVTVVGGGGNSAHQTIIQVRSGVANISYTCRVFYRALDTP
jgi:hypothetical protein